MAAAATPNITTGVGTPARVPRAQPGRRVERGRPLHHLELEEVGLAQSREEEARGQRGEERGHLGIGDQPAVDQPEGQRQAQRDREGRAERMAVLHQLQEQARGHGQRGDHRDVDAAADHHHRHAQPQDAEEGHVLHQREQVVDLREARQERREAREQQREQRGHDALLRGLEFLRRHGGGASYQLRAACSDWRSSRFMTLPLRLRGSASVPMVQVSGTA
jgi:hypothetical protein